MSDLVFIRLLPGTVKPPPGGWYQDLDQKILANVHPRGGLARGRGGIIRGGVRGFPRGATRGAMVVRGNVRGGRVINRGGIGSRGMPMNVQFRGGQRPPLRMPVRGGPVRVGAVRGGPMRGQMNGRGVRPMVRGGIRPGMRPMISRPGIRPGKHQTID